MEPKRYKSAYFLGIGGIGMSAIARYFKQLGMIVMGYDRTRTALTDQLASEGISIIYSDEVQALKDQSIHDFPVEDCLLVRTPAVPGDSALLHWFRERHYAEMKRAEVLGWLSKNHTTIAIAGTHGKTTTTTLVTHLLHEAGKDVMSFMGGISANFGTNYVAPKTTNPLLVVEADEFDRSFLHLDFNHAVITATDADHLDIYGSHEALVNGFAAFAAKRKPGGQLLLRKEIREITSFPEPYLTYSIQHSADASAVNIHPKGHHFVFDAKGPWGHMNAIELGVPGFHNVENALAAMVLCWHAGLTVDQLRSGLASFKGIQRRFQFIQETDPVFIDDYAHHPEELKAAIASARALFPLKHITGIFQPHLYSRTRDFADGFAASLQALDRIILLDIYPAREVPIPGVTSEIIFSKINHPNKFLLKKEELLAWIVTQPKPEVLMTLGAGDIDTLVQPLATWLQA